MHYVFIVEGEDWMSFSAAELDGFHDFAAEEDQEKRDGNNS